MGSPEKKEGGLRVGVMFYALEFQYFESIKMHLPCVNHKFHVLKMINKNTYKNSWQVRGAFLKEGAGQKMGSGVKRDR